MNDLSKLKLPPEVSKILSCCPGYVVAGSVDDLLKLAYRDAKNGWHEVAYDIPGKGRVVETGFAGCATV